MIALDYPVRKAGMFMSTKRAPLLSRFAICEIVVGLLTLVSLLTMAFSFLASFSEGHTNGAVSLDSQIFPYKPEQAIEWINAFDNQGRAVYIWTELTADLVFPVSYALTTSLGIYWASSKLRGADRPFTWLSRLPFIGMFADYLENVCVLILLFSVPSGPLFVAQLASILTPVKWAVDLTVGIVAISLFLIVGIKSVVMQISQPQLS